MFKNEIKIKDKEELLKVIKNEIKKNGNNCDLNHLDVSIVDDFSALFYYLPDFDGNISKWNTSSGRFFQSMFDGCKFNGDISRWNVSNAETLLRMFAHSFFNGDLSKWKPKKCEYMDNMFLDAKMENIPKWYKD